MSSILSRIACCLVGITSLMLYTMNTNASQAYDPDISTMQKKYDLTKLTWNQAVKNNFSKTQNGVHLTTDNSTYGYQIISTIPIGASKKVAIHFTVDVSKGGFQVAILNSSGVWLATRNFSGSGIYEGTIAADISGVAAQILVANNQPKPARSEFTINNLDVYMS